MVTLNLNAWPVTSVSAFVPELALTVVLVMVRGPSTFSVLVTSTDWVLSPSIRPVALLPRLD